MNTMLVQSIEQLVKKDVPLHYRNDYTALCKLAFPHGGSQEVPIEFSAEIKPGGERVIDVRVKERVNYPLIPVIRELKEKILVMEKDGLLR